MFEIPMAELYGNCLMSSRAFASDPMTAELSLTSRPPVNARLRENMSLEQRLSPSKITAGAVAKSSGIHHDEMELGQETERTRGANRNGLISVTSINTGSTPLPPSTNPNPPRFGLPITNTSQDFGADAKIADRRLLGAGHIPGHASRSRKIGGVRSIESTAARGRCGDARPLSRGPSFRAVGVNTLQFAEKEEKGKD
jgi:hypothetical protein